MIVASDSFQLRLISGFQQSIVSLVFQAVGIETGQIIGQLILKSSHYTHFRSFSPKWCSDDGFDLLVHSNPFEVKYVARPKEGDVAYVACLLKS